jgi:hypothetical protein
VRVLAAAFGGPLRADCRSRVPRDGLLMLNPLRSEGDAFRFLLYVIAVFGTIIAIVLIVRAI